MFSHNPDGTWTGHATCSYRGHLILHPENIATLLDNEPVQLSTSSCLLLELDGIQGWQSNYPFKKPVPHEPLSAWEPLDPTQHVLLKTVATPYPLEGVLNSTQIMKTFSHLTSVFEQQKKTSLVDVPVPILDLNSTTDLKLVFYPV